ncbi:hypothetical protein OO013_19940 [Mangrovivirga sp. M17]|uniref:Uncharacterized protein n=1 Tax=Mangrovivirga halotolerans TaxID=2993936 RepID=A0ABT3RWW6_9BACT|nr:hypothetical protein [Mangrovivirga halotolerans]MCX2746161.1 hypothetical protein [Mangrovivirga halotolerans]
MNKLIRLTANKTVYIIGTIGSIILVIKYYWDMNTINCEPCLPDAPCSPCRTDFMENFWTYIIIWNVLGFVFFKFRKRIKTDANKRYE